MDDTSRFAKRLCVVLQDHFSYSWETSAENKSKSQERSSRTDTAIEREWQRVLSVCGCGELKNKKSTEENFRLSEIAFIWVLSYLLYHNCVRTVLYKLQKPTKRISEYNNDRSTGVKIRKSINYARFFYLFRTRRSQSRGFVVVEHQHRTYRKSVNSAPALGGVPQTGERDDYDLCGEIKYSLLFRQSPPRAG